MFGFFGAGVIAVFRIWVVLFFINMPNLYAANPYQLGGVDYFGYKEEDALNNDQHKPFNWQETSITADGSVSNYTPPGPMLSLLENPTPENAKAYLVWQRQKIDRIFRAQEAIDQALKEQQ